MSGFGAVFLMMSLVHEFWFPDDLHKPFLVPYAAAAFAFYAGIDITAAGVVSAWKKATGKN